jgi:hypothetical protein
MANSIQPKYMNIPINNILKKMQPITLDEMSNIRLMDRIDSKYMAPLALLPSLLEAMLSYFKVQIIDNEMIASYTTQYLDTSGLDMFVMHQNGKLNRQKIRIRSYVNSNLSFLEIKNKNNKGRTRKIRIQVGFSHLASICDLDKEKQFLCENSAFNPDDLTPVLANKFKRITLVNNTAKERITIDFELSFFNYKTKNKQKLDKIMILELKQDGRLNSDFREILNRFRIKPVAFSKYCMGTVLTNPGSKYNRFKNKCIIINKLMQKTNDAIRL